jgi:hypothetical protein
MILMNLEVIMRMTKIIALYMIKLEKLQNDVVEQIITIKMERRMEI